MTRALLAQGQHFTKHNATFWLDKGIYYVQTKSETREFDNLAAARAYWRTL